MFGPKELPMSMAIVGVVVVVVMAIATIASIAIATAEEWLSGPLHPSLGLIFIMTS